MSDPQFYQVYLREIGVHTPISFSADAPTTSQIQAKPVVKPVDPLPASQPQHITATLDELIRDASVCVRCSLAQTRTQVVFGTGNPHAEIIFIGEAPGRDEDLQGEPFVGRAGQLLDRMLAAIALDRTKAYIMNTIKCRPPQNRDPLPAEIQACQPWFDAQLDLLRPKVICLLGRVAAQTVLQSDAPLGSMRGRWHEYRGIPVWVTYHPAFLLRSPSQKKRSWDDLLVLRRKLDALQAQAQAGVS